jgi:hypothetical protein
MKKFIVNSLITILTVYLFTSGMWILGSILFVMHILGGTLCEMISPPNNGNGK